MWISANDERMRYTGRIDWRVELEPVKVPENELGVHHALFFKRQDGCHELHKFSV